MVFQFSQNNKSLFVDGTMSIKLIITQLVLVLSGMILAIFALWFLFRNMKLVREKQHDDEVIKYLAARNAILYKYVLVQTQIGRALARLEINKNQAEFFLNGYIADMINELSELHRPESYEPKQKLDVENL